ncbi:metallophosphoesterase family protein [Roseburia inulinivorans]|nr:exonuclease subunit SbcD [Roseburia inulinivorans]
MKFFHLSDLHIGKQLHHYNMIAEQRDILGKIVALAEREKPDAVLIAGDVYDTPVPSAEAVSVFDEFLTALNDLEPEVTVCIIAGNHDSAKRIDFASDILAKHRVMIAGMPPLTREETIRKVSFLMHTARYAFTCFLL